MLNILFLITMLLIPDFAMGSYRDGFFGFGMLVLGLPVLLIGISITVVYVNRRWFYDRTFTIFYAVIWFVVFFIFIAVTSAASVDNSDTESVKLIFWGLSTYYLFIIFPAVMQYRRNKRRE